MPKSLATSLGTSILEQFREWTKATPRIIFPKTTSQLLKPLETVLDSFGKPVSSLVIVGSVLHGSADTDTQAGTVANNTKALYVGETATMSQAMVERGWCQSLSTAFCV